MLAWVGAKAVSYVALPMSKWIGVAVASSIGSKIGLGIVGRLWKTSVDKLRGLVTHTFKRSLIYIVINGDVITVSPRKQYIIVRGEVRELDIDDTILACKN